MMLHSPWKQEYQEKENKWTLKHEEKKGVSERSSQTDSCYSSILCCYFWFLLAKFWLKRLLIWDGSWFWYCGASGSLPVYAVLTTPWYFCTCILHTFDLKAKSSQNSSKCRFTFAFQHCLLTTRRGYIWDRRLNLSVICWVDMSLWRRGNVICSQRFLIWAPNEWSLFAFTLVQLISLYLPQTSIFILCKSHCCCWADVSDKVILGTLVSHCTWLNSR